MMATKIRFVVIIHFLLFSIGDGNVHSEIDLTRINSVTSAESTTLRHATAHSQEPTSYHRRDDDSTNFTFFETVAHTHAPVKTTELTYLEFEYEFMDRETFWRNNTFVCVNGTLLPSSYLQHKYTQCEKIHRNYNPQCTMNCEMAITMLLGPKRIPTLDLFERYFNMTLPDNIRKAAMNYSSHCFEKFGKNDDDFLDWSCNRPQPFFECIKRLRSKLVCPFSNRERQYSNRERE